MNYRRFAFVSACCMVLTGCGENDEIAQTYLRHGPIDTRESLQANVERLSDVEKIKESAPDPESLSSEKVEFKETGREFYVGKDTRAKLEFELGHAGNKIHTVLITKRKTIENRNITLDSIERDFGIPSDRREKTIARGTGEETESYYFCKGGKVGFESCALIVFLDTGSDQITVRYYLNWRDLTFDIKD